jgi:hypothetical protein
MHGGGRKLARSVHSAEYGGTRVRIRAAHNPEVAGSNPAPRYWKGPGDRAFRCLISDLELRSHRDRHAHEGCGNGGGITARVGVLSGEELLQFGEQLGLAAVEANAAAAKGSFAAARFAGASLSAGLADS